MPYFFDPGQDMPSMLPWPYMGNGGAPEKPRRPTGYTEKQWAVVLKRWYNEKLLPWLRGQK